MSRIAIYIIIITLFLGLAAYYLVKLKFSFDNYFFSTQSQSNERLKNVRLDKPSENASYILDINKLSFIELKKETKNVEYKADPYKDWIIDLIPVNGDSFRKEDFSKVFDYEWRSKFQSTIYGFSPEKNGWTFANVGGSPEIYSKLQVAIDVQSVFHEDSPSYNPKKLDRYIIELEARIKKYPAKIKLEHKESTESAIRKAKELDSLYQEFNRNAIIILQSDKLFDGTETWDALQSVGLKWGDGDLFHWNNDTNYGHDQHFSVWTTSEPGYFLPEDIKDGSMNPQNLVFGFSIPRSADPKNVFEIMSSTVMYCQKRLGGKMLDQNMRPFNLDESRKKIKELLSNMKSKGIEAGSDKALRMF